MCALRTFDCYSTRLKKSAHLLYVSFAVFWELFEMMRLFLYADACQTRHLPTTSYPELRDCLLVSCRRLVGIAVVVHPGSLVQVTVGVLISLIYLVVQHQAGPYRELADDFVALASSFSLTVFFICCTILKVGDLVELNVLRVRLSTTLVSTFDVPSQCATRGPYPTPPVDQLTSARCPRPPHAPRQHPTRHHSTRSLSTRQHPTRSLLTTPISPTPDSLTLNSPTPDSLTPNFHLANTLTPAAATSSCSRSRASSCA